jgi:hypothetical protein
MRATRARTRTTRPTSQPTIDQRTGDELRVPATRGELRRKVRRHPQPNGYRRPPRTMHTNIDGYDLRPLLAGPRLPGLPLETHL